MEEEVKKVIEEYLRSYYNNDFEKLIALLDEGETKVYLEKIVAFAIEMDQFGESEEFLQKIEVQDLAELKALSSNDFMHKLLKLSKREIGAEEINRIVAGIEITDIQIDAQIATVDYTLPMSFFGEIEKVASKIKLTKQTLGWRIHFKSGLDRALATVQKEVDLYFERKAKDLVQNLNHHPNDLERVTLIGYKNIYGEMVFEPRFKDGGDFADSFAYVKIMSKYGYIDQTGELVIKPQFQRARDFSEGLAGVQLVGDYNYGFINKKGTLVIKPRYDDVSVFNEGLCAVNMEDKWGYIDTQGKIVIACQYEEASDFWSETTEVVIIDSEGAYESIYINKKGEIASEEE